MARRKKIPQVEVGRSELKHAALLDATTAALLQPRGTDMSEVRVVALDAILPRAGIETRALAAGHVLALAQSIAALGLLEPIVVDLQTRLLAGGHRLAALRLLAAADRAAHLGALAGATPEQAAAAGELDAGDFDFARVPVRVMRFDSTSEVDLALGIETAENEHRKDYSRADVKRLLKRLEAAGYRTEPGRPKRGETAAIPLIQAVVGKSRAQVFRMLREDDEKTVARETVSSLDRAKASARKALSRLLDEHLADMPQKRATEARRLLEWCSSD